MDNHKNKPNRLINENSPYLLQHAYNPVQWFPWGEEAFDKAKREDKPIFLSIGYSTCHWCHVMERESFEDREVAELLNSNFISVKVDREARPDIDAIYMAAAQAFTGSGGWPLTIVMTPELKPFYAGTYFPKRRRYNMPGLMDILDSISCTWQNDRKKLIESGNEVTDLISSNTAVSSEGRVSKAMVAEAAAQLKKQFDEKYGGFGSSPKFPTPANLLFLLRYGIIENDSDAVHMVEKTIESIYRGGIFDHIGGGISRYSTDRIWMVPHFEKMLYDNALMVYLLAESYMALKKDIYRTMATRIIDYIEREMTDPEGGFYCAQDADSSGEEGKYYVFVPREIKTVLGEEKGAEFCRWYGITEAGNFEGQSIPNLIGKELKDNPDAQGLKKLLSYRQDREQLHKDDKILTSWSSMMVSAYARAGRAFGEAEYIHRGEKALQFIREKMTGQSGRLAVSYRQGAVSGEGGLDDYAYYVWALTEMYEVTGKSDYLHQAVRYNGMMKELFARKEGGYYMTGQDMSHIIFRPLETYDGAIPSGNSAAALNLVKLAKITASTVLEEESGRQLDFLAASAADYPSGHCLFMTAALYALYPTAELVCVIPKGTEIPPIYGLFSGDYNPLLSITIKREGVKDAETSFTDEYTSKNGKITYYLCKDKACSIPVTDAKELRLG